MASPKQLFNAITSHHGVSNCFCQLISVDRPRMLQITESLKPVTSIAIAASRTRDISYHFRTDLMPSDVKHLEQLVCLRKPFDLTAREHSNIGNGVCVTIDFSQASQSTHTAATVAQSSDGAARGASQPGVSVGITGQRTYQ